MIIKYYYFGVQSNKAISHMNIFKPPLIICPWIPLITKYLPTSLLYIQYWTYLWHISDRKP